MQSLTTVKGLQILKDQPACLSVRLIGRVFHVFGCEFAVETLHERVVITCVFAILTQDKSSPSQQPLIALTNVTFYHSPNEAVSRTPMRKSQGPHVFHQNGFAARIHDPSHKILRSKTSSTTAGESHPSIVQIAVISATHLLLGTVALKSRSKTFSTAASLRWLSIVRVPCRRWLALHPRSHINRATRFFRQWRPPVPSAAWIHGKL